MDFSLPRPVVDHEMPGLCSTEGGVQQGNPGLAFPIEFTVATLEQHASPHCSRMNRCTHQHLVGCLSLCW